MHPQTARLFSLQTRGRDSINWSSKLPARTWETNTAISVIYGYGLPVNPQCHSVQRTPLDTKAIPRTGSGIIEQHHVHTSIVHGSEPFPKSNLRFDPFADEPAPPEHRTMCPKMAEFLITEEFNQNPYPDYGQWDEDKAMLQALNDRVSVAHPSERVATSDNGPIIHQPQPVSMKDHADALEMILAYAEHVESNEDIPNKTGAYHPAFDATITEQALPSPDSEFDEEADSDAYSSDGFSDTCDIFCGVSPTSSTETTPDSPTMVLETEDLSDVKYFEDMEAKDQACWNVAGLGLRTQVFEPANFKGGLNALDLTKALQRGNLVGIFSQAASGSANASSLAQFPVWGAYKTDGLVPFTPSSP